MKVHVFPHPFTTDKVLHEVWIIFMDAFNLLFESRLKGKTDHQLLCPCGYNMLRNRGIEGGAFEQKKATDVLVTNTLQLLYMTFTVSFSFCPDRAFTPLSRTFRNPEFYLWIRIVPLQGTYKDHWVQLLDHLRANKKVKCVFEGHTCLPNSDKYGAPTTCLGSL